MKAGRRKKVSYICLLTMTISMLACIVFADVGPDWMSAGGDVKQEVGTMSEKFFKGVILFAAAVSTISFAWGLAEYNGLIGESERGARRIKRSLVIIAACGLSYAIVAFVAG